MNKNSLYDAASRIFLGQDYEFTRLITYVKKEIYQDYEFTRLNTYEKKEMSEELPRLRVYSPEHLCKERNE